MKKKLNQLLHCFIVVIAFAFVLSGVIATTVSAIAFAEEIEGVEDEALVENVEAEPVAEVVEAETPTFLGRIMEYLTANYTEIATTVGDSVLVIIFLVNFVKSKKEMLGINKKVTFTSSAQSDVVDVVNGLVEGYNKIETKLQEYNTTESQKYETVGSMVVQTKAILDILMTVYANSKNLPQGVKDLVNVKYAAALKLLGDTLGLQEVVDNNSNIASETETVSVATDVTAEG